MVEPMLEWTPFEPAEVDQVAELADACAWIDDPVDRPSRAQLVEDLAHPLADPSRNGVVGRDRSGAVLAAGWLLFRTDDEHRPRVWLHWLVHPQARHRQIGYRLVTWLTSRAHEWAQERGVDEFWMGAYVDTKLTLRRDNLLEAGFSAERWFADMHLSFDDVDPHALPDELTEGVRIVPFDPEQHSEQVRVAHNRAFAGLPGAMPIGRSDWDLSLRGASTRPQWSFVALGEDDRVIGYALSSAYQQDWDVQGWSEGWTDRVGVVPERRGHRIGQALLRRVLVSFAEAGLDGAGLGVDTGGLDAGEQASAAVRLFARLGYQEADSVVLYGRVCRPVDAVGYDDRQQAQGEGDR
ncbi:GNAT family N-acetyltransferase [Aestuariimicrobium soli]|uniref:GNAT family N-acetyltransferase n=1 Tax=Aestuariimicrobium soli TaxID=2035834 RepID=UPI003EBA0A34